MRVGGVDERYKSKSEGALKSVHIHLAHTEHPTVGCGVRNGFGDKVVSIHAYAIMQFDLACVWGVSVFAIEMTGPRSDPS